MVREGGGEIVADQAGRLAGRHVIRYSNEMWWAYRYCKSARAESSLGKLPEKTLLSRPLQGTEYPQACRHARTHARTHAPRVQAQSRQACMNGEGVECTRARQTAGRARVDAF